ncbi:hypothetical protein NKI50_27530 [Mesorhizobium sp. M0563]|uniref:hypothetical protein n=1 Tax=Mesorhizobium sp. M0563 TaxID=2956959 RepID=UPI00333C2CEE
MGSSEQAAGAATQGAKKSPSYGGDKWDWYLAVVVLILVIIALSIYLLRHTTWPELSLLLAGVLGAVMGWAAGICVTPYTIWEQTRLNGIGKLIAGLATGYLVAKLDRVFDILLPKTLDNATLVSTGVLSHFAVWLTMFIAVAVVTYVTRSYDLYENKKTG